MNGIPLLRCLKVHNLDKAVEDMTRVITSLGDYQKHHHPEEKWKTPAYTYTMQKPVIEISEDTEQDQLDEVAREMRQPPHSPEKPE